MDAAKVKAFCDAATALLPEIASYAAADPNHRTANDNALVRELRVSGMALGSALTELARMIPIMPPMPAPPPPAPPPKQGS